MSYSHAADGQLAPALQAGLQSLGKPWYRRRALRVFRDKTSLSASPHLWAAIVEAMAASRYFILLASPEAADSPWVDQEVAWWLQHRNSATMLIGLTGGDLAWDGAHGVFNPVRSTALPPAALNRVGGEPLWVDLRWAREARHVSLRDPRFREVVADLAAPIHGMPKDELIGEDIRQHRRTLRVARTALAVLLALVVAASTSTVVAVRRAEEARRQRDTATSRLLAAIADTKVDTDPQLAALLSLEAFRIRKTDDARISMLNQLQHRRAVKRFLTGHFSSVSALAFSPDGRTLASGGADNRILLWDVGHQMNVATLGYPGVVGSLQFSPDGKVLAVTGQHNTIDLWDIALRRRLTTLLTNTPVNSDLAFSPDGQFLASASNFSHDVTLWDLSHYRVFASLHGHSNDVDAVAFSPEGHILASGGTDHSVILWDVKRRKKVTTLRLQKEHAVQDIAFSPDGRTLAIGSFYDVSIWAVKQSARIASLKGEGAVAFSHDGRVLAFRGEDGNIVLWDLRTNLERDVLPGRAVVAFHPKNDLMLASAGPENTVVLWDISPMPHLGVTLTTGENDDLLNGLAFGSDNRTIFASYQTEPILAWDSFRKESTELTGIGVHPGPIAVSPDGTILAACLESETMVLWDLNRRTTAATFDGCRSGSGMDHTISFSRDSRFVATAGPSGKIIVWDIQRRVQTAAFNQGVGDVNATSLSPDGRILASGDADPTRRSGKYGRVILWDIARRAPIVTFEDTAYVESVVFSPDGRTVASGGDNIVTLWDIERRFKLATLTGRADAKAGNLAFSPDGRLLASGTEGGVVIWDVARRTQVTVLIGHSAVVNGVAFSPDGRKLASSAGDGSIVVWDIDVLSWQHRLCMLIGRELTDAEWTAYLPPGQPRRAACP